jgi:hypothetical protein
MAAASHKAAADALGTQMAGSQQAKQMVYHRAQVDEHLRHAEMHGRENQRFQEAIALPGARAARPVGNPTLTYGAGVDPEASGARIAERRNKTWNL